MCAGEFESGHRLCDLSFPVMSVVIFKLTHYFSTVFFFYLDMIVHNSAQSTKAELDI